MTAPGRRLEGGWWGSAGARTRWFLAGLLTWFLAHLLIGPLAGERIRATLTERLAHKLERSVSIGGVDIGLFPWPSLTVTHFALGPGERLPQLRRLRIETLEIVPGVMRSVLGAPTLDRVVLRHPVIHWDPAPPALRQTARRLYDDAPVTPFRFAASPQTDPARLLRPVSTNAEASGSPSSTVAVADEPPPDDPTSPDSLLVIQSLQIRDAALAFWLPDAPVSRGFTNADITLSEMRLTAHSIRFPDGAIHRARLNWGPLLPGPTATAPRPRELGRIGLSGGAALVGGAVSADLALRTPHLTLRAAGLVDRTRPELAGEMRFHLALADGGDPLLGRRGLARSLVDLLRPPVIGAGEFIFSTRFRRRTTVLSLTGPQLDLHWPDGVTLHGGPFTQPVPLAHFRLRLTAAAAAVAPDGLRTEGARLALRVVGLADDHLRHPIPFPLPLDLEADRLALSWEGARRRLALRAQGGRIAGWRLGLADILADGPGLAEASLAGLLKGMVRALRQPDAAIVLQTLEAALDVGQAAGGGIGVERFDWRNAAGAGAFQGAITWDRNARNLTLAGDWRPEGAGPQGYRLTLSDRVGRAELALRRENAPGSR